MEPVTIQLNFAVLRVAISLLIILVQHAKNMMIRFSLLLIDYSWRTVSVIKMEAPIIWFEAREY